jgi:hypothetical protein
MLDESPPLELISTFVSCFYSLPVKVLPPILRLSKFYRQFFTIRSHHEKTMASLNIKLEISFNSSKKRYLPTHSVCLLFQWLIFILMMIGISFSDKVRNYYQTKLNKLASLVSRVGVFSFARYDPVFYGENRDKDYKKLLLWRCLRVVVHEIGHIFGVKHCVM